MGYEGIYVFGSQIFSKEPLAMVTRGDDSVFADFVNWVFQSLATAEAMNITQTDAYSFPSTDLFGPKYSNMFAHAIAAVGNYGELYDRHIEDRFPRSGMNYVNQGDTGHMYAMPFGNLDLNQESATVVPGSMLDTVNGRSIVVCGVLSDRPWLGITNDAFGGLDAEFCRALSAAKFNGNTNRLAIIEYDTIEEGFDALDKKIIDVFASAPQTLRNDVQYDLSPPYFFDPNSDSSYVMATRQDDQQWSDFVRWCIYSTIYAEEKEIESDNADKLPTMRLFGPAHIQMFRNMYNRTQEELVPRSGRNLLNSGGPQMVARPSDFGFQERL
jgi:hypothetical protein